MTGQAMLGRGVAAVGLVCAVVAIWVKFAIGRAYWDDGTLGGLLLILAILGALVLVGALATNRSALDAALGAIGGTLLGLYLWYPAVFATDQWDVLDKGAWLGVCSALVLIGALIALGPSMAAGAHPAAIGTLLALVGLGLVLAGLWTKTTNEPGTYWNVPGAGHSLGVLMLILVVLSAVAVAAAHAARIGQDAALAVAGATLGITVFLPVLAAFNNLDELRAGAWLAGIGGIVLMVGVVAMRLLAGAGVPAPAPPAPAPPPPPPPPAG